VSATPHETSQPWARARERGAFSLLRLMFWLVRRAGRTVLSPILRAISFYFFVFGRTARAASLDYLRRVERALPETRVRADRVTSYRHFDAFTDAILDKVDAWSGKITRENVRFADLELLRSVVDSRRGLLVIGSHLGNLEVCRALGEISQRVRLNVLAYTQHAGKINRVFEMAGARGFQLIQVTDLDIGLALQLRERIEAGEWVVIAGDRVPLHGGRTTTVSLLGAPAPIPIGPYVLAALLGCPVYLMFCLRRAGQNTIYFEQFADRIEWDRRERDSVIAQLAQRYAGRLEHYIGLAPLQWFNFYPFWSER
jgi:predicted LPLAT superfamily acyltransferase